VNRGIVTLYVEERKMGSKEVEGINGDRTVESASGMRGVAKCG
jgi:hypothetical protein